MASIYWMWRNNLYFL